jgi:FkbM family methyltransferase
MVSRFTAHWRKRTKPKVIKVDGLNVCTVASLVTRQIQRALYTDTYEKPERVLVSKAIAAGDRILEIGAGIGVVSLICARICGQESILSYEANPIAASVLKYNFSLNNMVPNLRIRAVGKNAGPVDFHFHDNIFSSSLVRRGETEKSQVEADAISAVLMEFQPNVLVIDAEGAEIELLPEVVGTSVHKIIAELHPHIVGELPIQGMIDGLQNAGFSKREIYGKVAWLEKDPGTSSKPE